MSSLSAAKRKLLEENSYKSYKDSTSKSKNIECSTKHSKEKKSKKSKKSKKKHKKSSSESSDSSDSDEWVEKAPSSENKSTKNEPAPREDWMSMMGSFKTYDREKEKSESTKDKKGQIDAYNPSQSARELNPYWKHNGTGLPENNRGASGSRSSYHENSSKFKRPTHEDETYYRKSETSHRRKDDDDDYYRSRRNWRKNDKTDSFHSSKEKRESDDDILKPPTEKLPEVVPSKTSLYMSDEEMNRLGSKIVKAEIMGNTDLFKELSSKLEKAREYRKLHPEEKPASKKEDVMLTITDAKGNSVPLRRSENAGDVRSKGGKKKMETHSMSGDRVRFFADDDKYSLKQMFENEKFGNADDSKEEFARAMAKHKNPNDDLDDIFSEKITKKVSDAKLDQQNMHKAISQHQSIQKSLDTCEYCVESDKMNKQMIITVGNKVYLSLPDRMSLVENHCIISTISHTPCVTMADEDVWSEILTFRKALVKMCNSRKEDIVFFETVVYLNKYPHLIVHCVPLPRDVGDTAAIYFKKAILECETEWSNNKKVVDLRGKDIRRGVPKGLPYFWVDFGMDPGFAHVIEDQQLFPKNFAQEIIGGMLDLDHKRWRKPHKDNFEFQKKKVKQFSSVWDTFNPVADSKGE